jgi:hypothetical protein
VVYFAVSSFTFPDRLKNSTPTAIEDMENNFVISFDNILILILLVPIIAFPIILLPQFGRSATKKGSLEKWEKPSWNLNPFQWKQPLQFFHLGGFCFIAAGLVGIFRSLVYGPSMLFFNLFTLSGGLGVLLSVMLAQKLYAEKFNKEDEALDLRKS